MSQQVLTSPAALVGEDQKPDNAPALPPLVQKQVGPFEIAPIETFADWVVVVPFTIDTLLELPADSDYRNIGIVVGRSNSIMSPNGMYVPSRLEYGMVVYFQKRSVIGEMAIHKDPYVGKRLIILSERNIICRLPAIPYKVLDYNIGVDDFPAIQPAK